MKIDKDTLGGALIGKAKKFGMDNQVEDCKPITGPVSNLKPMERRRFLGNSLLGVMGLGVSASPLAAQNESANEFVGKGYSEATDLFKKQSDSFEDKIELIREAWSNKDYRLVRALSDSIRNTGIQAQVDDEDLGEPLSPANQFGNVASLPLNYRDWAKGWKYYKVIGVEESAGIKRSSEPIEVLLGFPSSQVASLFREIRVAEIVNGELREVTSQVHSVMHRNAEKLCKVIFLADSDGQDKRNYLIFYGNPDAELPDYPTDLKVRGEGYSLEIENKHYIATLSKQTGQLERMLIKREHGVELYAGGPGHGETACIDWAHDYVSEDNFMKVRIQYWDRCPDYEIIRGPICTIVRRWGFPYSALHPIYNPSRLNIDIEYRFYSGLPYFHKIGEMKAVKEFVATALRDDEWVFTGQPFTDTFWIGNDGKIVYGKVEKDERSVKGFGFYNEDSKDSFVGLYLDHSSEVIPEILDAGHVMFYYRWHGSVWARYPLERNQLVPKGAVLRQRNAYVTLPFTKDDGPKKIELLRKELLSPMHSYAAALDTSMLKSVSSETLARRGEAQDSPINKKLLWDALKSCIDQQLYIANVNLVELGYIYDISVTGDVVHVLMSMPNRGRPQSSFFIWGSSVVHRTTSKTIVGALMEVPGVGEVFVDQTWHPQWTSNFINEEGRKKLGI